MRNARRQCYIISPTVTWGFMGTGPIRLQYELDGTTSRRRGVRHSFFAGASVKSIGETHLSSIVDVLPAQLIAGVKSVTTVIER